jgi:hypothetical protein
MRVSMFVDFSNTSVYQEEETRKPKKEYSEYMNK